MTSICLSMIVKNEERVLARCLRSVRPLISSWIICDTGSTDRTEEVARAALEGIPGEFVRRPWIDFATNRNEALAMSRKRADYSLIIDADDELEYAPGFVLPWLTHDVYAIRNRLQERSFYRRHLLKSSFAWKFVGVVHEAPQSDGPASEAVLAGVTYRVNPGEGARSRDPQKYLRDAQVLERALEKDPNNATYMYFLAQSYRDHGDLEKARYIYERHVDMESAAADDKYMALCQIARIAASSGSNLDDLVMTHLKAHMFRPTRAEPLCELATSLRGRGEAGLAHVFAAAARSYPKPTQSGATVVDEDVYDWRALYEYATGCIAIGLEAEAKSAFDRLAAEGHAPAAALETLGKKLARGSAESPSEELCKPFAGRLVGARHCQPHLTTEAEVRATRGLAAPVTHPLLVVLERELAAIGTAYSNTCAGQPRASRDAAILDALAERAGKVVRQLESAPPDARGRAFDNLVATARARVEVLEQERRAALEAARLGDDYTRFARAASRANATLASYARNFDGKARTVADLGLLEELTPEAVRSHEELRSIASRHPESTIGADVETLGAAIALLREEHATITRMLASLSERERAGALAGAANDQFDLYETMFAGKSRLTRRPGLLRRMIRNLARIQEQVSAIARGEAGTGHVQRNLAVIEQKRAAYEAELAAITATRDQAGGDAVAGALGAAANEVFTAYGREISGRERRLVNAKRMTLLCEELGELARQMEEISPATKKRENQHNLELVIDQQVVFDTELALVNAARG